MPAARGEMDGLETAQRNGQGEGMAGEPRASLLHAFLPLLLLQHFYLFFFAPAMFQLSGCSFILVTQAAEVREPASPCLHVMQIIQQTGGKKRRPLHFRCQSPSCVGAVAARWQEQTLELPPTSAPLLTPTACFQGPHVLRSLLSPCLNFSLP